MTHRGRQPAKTPANLVLWTQPSKNGAVNSFSAETHQKQWITALLADPLTHRDMQHFMTLVAWSADIYDDSFRERLHDILTSRYAGADFSAWADLLHSTKNPEDTPQKTSSTARSASQSGNGTGIASGGVGRMPTTTSIGLALHNPHEFHNQ